MRTLSSFGLGFPNATYLNVKFKTEYQSQSHMTFDDNRQLYIIQAIVDRKLMDIQFTEVQ